MLGLDEVRFPSTAEVYADDEGYDLDEFDAQIYNYFNGDGQ